MITSFSNINAESIALKMKHQNQAKEARQAEADLTAKELHNRKLKEASDGFEELFVHKMIQVMRQSNHKGDHLLHGGRGEEVFQDMLDEQYSKEFTKSGSLDK